MGKIVLRLDRMMVERKMSLNELAERVGISNVNLSKIKNNKVTAIRFATLAAICEVLDCKAGDILEFQKDNVRMMREIGIFAIDIPVIGFIMSVITRLVCGVDFAEICVDMGGISMGIIVLCFSQFFAHGVKLENDVDGLL